MMVTLRAKSSRGLDHLGPLLALCLVSLPAQSQGCAQCREAVGQTPARTQQAYRHGIEVLVLAAGSIFTASVFLFRRYR